MFKTISINKFLRKFRKGQCKFIAQATAKTKVKQDPDEFDIFYHYKAIMTKYADMLLDEVVEFYEDDFSPFIKSDLKIVFQMMSDKVKETASKEDPTYTVEVGNMFKRIYKTIF